MKTSSFALGLALAMSLSVAGAASAQASQRPERPHAAQSDSGFRGRRGGPDAMLLRGITLSENQKTRLQELRANARKEFGQQGPRQRPGAPQGAARDTVGMGARRAEMNQRREQHFAAVRSILDSQQRSQFDKNVTEMKAHGPRQDRGTKGGHA